MSVMGPGALYMSYITGNVTNLRMPATVGTINSLGIKPNTDECHTMAIIACGASIITTVVIVALGVVIAAPLAPVLESPVIQPAFDYVVPALFGGLVAQTILKGKKQFLFFLAPLAICLFFFAFSTIIGWYFFGEQNIKYLFGTKGTTPYRLIVMGFIVLGSVLQVDLCLLYTSPSPRDA